MKPTISVIIVNYHSGECLERCLTQVLASNFSGKIKITVVNNSPEDGYSETVAANFAGVKVLNPEHNLGFGPANNWGFAESRGDYFLLVNPDAFAPIDAIQQCVDFLEANPGVGVVGPRFVSLEGVPQPSARMFPTLLNKVLMLSGLANRYPRSRFFGRMDMTWWDHSHPKPVDWVVGAFMMVRAELVYGLKGFDPRFFLYFEELEFCRRVRKAGSKVYILPQIVVTHIGGVSSSRTTGSDRAGKQLTLWRLFAEALYYGKYHGKPGVWLMLGFERLWYWLRWLRRCRDPNPQKRAEAEAFARQIEMIDLAQRVTHYGRFSPPHPWSLDLREYEPFQGKKG